MSIGIVGAGAFGTALAIALAQAGQSVLLWTHRNAQATAMAETHENADRLPGIALPEGITPTSEASRLATCDLILMAVPLQQLRGVVTDLKADIEGKPCIACCKGIEIETGLGPVAILSDILPGTPVALLTGPSFARDIAMGLPTALTLACQNVSAGEVLQAQLSTPTLRIYRTSDTVGAELGGALKNVIAIGCGAAIGHGMGDSARAALLTRGFAEMQRLSATLGAKPETLMGLSGLGDLVLTCTSDLSRNYRYGLAIGRGDPFLETATVEGTATAQAIARMAAAQSLDLPICTTIAALCAGQTNVADAIGALLSRPLKEE